MRADAGFRIGKTHSICQDYAAASNNSRCMAALADGCSTAPNTDVGARLLVHSALACRQGAESEPWTTTGLASTLLPPGVSSECLKATLGVVWKDGSWAGVAQASLFGDGIIFGVRVDGQVELTEVSYSGNMPAYPAYSVLQVSRNEIAAAVEAQTGGPWNRMLRRTFLGVEEVLTEVVERILAPSATRTFYSSEGWSVIGILSDGASSCYRITKTSTSKVMEPVSLAKIAPQLLRFGSLDGPFVVSRLKHFSAWCEKNGIYHGDDLAMAAIAFTEAP